MHVNISEVTSDPNAGWKAGCPWERADKLWKVLRCLCDGDDRKGAKITFVKKSFGLLTRPWAELFKAGLR